MRIPKPMLSLLATLAFLYVCLLGLLLVFERNFIFFPQFPGRLSGNWHPQGLAVEDVWLTAEDGVKLHAWWIPAPGEQASPVPVILAFHGNAANLPNREEIFRLLREAPAHVLAVEYRGYGKSEGRPSEAGIYADARAGYDYLTRQRGIAPGRIIVYGASLGTAVATDLAVNRKVGGVTLEAPFPSVAALARRVYWFLPGLGALARTKLDTVGKISRMQAPLLVLHCTRDPVIPIEFGRQVYAAAAQPKRFVEIEGECHETASLVAPKEFLGALREFASSLPKS